MNARPSLPSDVNVKFRTITAIEYERKRLEAPLSSDMNVRPLLPSEVNIKVRTTAAIECELETS